jgi:hypothetical protein
MLRCKSSASLLRIVNWPLKIYGWKGINSKCFILWFIKITAFWDIELCSLVESTDVSEVRTASIIRVPDNVGSTNFWNNGLLQGDYTALYPEFCMFIFAVGRNWNLISGLLFHLVLKFMWTSIPVANYGISHQHFAHNFSCVQLGPIAK